VSPHQVTGKPKPARVLHLWEIVAARDVLALAAIVGAMGLAYALRGILTPVLIAFALAYVVDPIVGGLHRAARVPRVASAVALLVALLVGLALFGIWLMPPLVRQLDQLADQAPVYWDTLREHFSGLDVVPTSAESAVDSALQVVEPDTMVRGSVEGAGQLLHILGGMVGTAGYLAVAGVLIPLLFITFATYFDRLGRIRRFIPADHRDRTWALLQKVDAAFSGYVRGQLIVAVFTTTGFGIGFYLAGVPYWFVVSLIGGTLSLIPYGQCSGWLLAMVFKLADSLTGAEPFSWFGVILAPSIVYLITQSMESWVITPIAQGEATNQHPIVVLVALVIGGAVAGIIGLILAVPVVASARALFSELVLPRLERWADARGSPSDGGGGAARPQPDARGNRSSDFT
jgi:predicted PurR-regulated permease PerM